MVLRLKPWKSRSPPGLLSIDSIEDSPYRDSFFTVLFYSSIPHSLLFLGPTSLFVESFFFYESVLCSIVDHIYLFVRSREDSLQLF